MLPKYMLHLVRNNHGRVSRSILILREHEYFDFCPRISDGELIAIFVVGS